jgi:mRNA interferase RelE/StbE
MEIVWEAQPLKMLRRTPRNDARRIRAKVHQYAQRPESLANRVKKLQGRDGYRLRVGNWRTLFTQDGRVLTVIRIGPRGKVYT